jgi:hypothetical protein
MGFVSYPLLYYRDYQLIRADFQRGKYNNESVFCILDDFTFECFKPEFQLIKVSRYAWKYQLSLVRPKFLFCESVWKANGGQWNFAGFQRKKPTHWRPLTGLISLCNTLGVPTVYFNKEDPPNFDRFIDSATLFDVIFTTEERLIPEYQRRAPRAKVAAMMFAAQPRIHNPFNYRRSDEICFAGAWRGWKYPERAKSLGNMIDMIVEMKEKMVIYDRNYFLPEANDRFPQKYKSYVKPPISYEILSGEYKNFKAMLNVNAVSDSQTMCARRIFEIINSRTPILTSYSPAIIDIFGENIYMENYGSGWEQYFRDSEVDCAKKVHLNYRKVLSHHTYLHRANQIRKILGLPEKDFGPHVIVECSEDNLSKVEELYGYFKMQTYPKISFRYKGNNVQCHHLSTQDSNPSEAFVTIFQSGFIYGANYVSDLVLNLHTDPGFELHKSSYYAFNPQTGTLHLLNPRLDFQNIEKGNESLNGLRNIQLSSKKVSVDPFNLLQVSESFSAKDIREIKRCTLEEALELVMI